MKNVKINFTMTEPDLEGFSQVFCPKHLASTVCFIGKFHYTERFERSDEPCCKVGCGDTKHLEIVE